MSHSQLFDLRLFHTVSAPPPGSVNVALGESVAGPGGRWIPCATRIAEGIYCASLFEVGPGRSQVSAPFARFRSAAEALRHAIELARSAAA